jgi:hypothetical protein
MENVKMDYAVYYLEIKRLLREVHDLMNERQYAEAKVKIEEMMANNKLLLNVTKSHLE